MILIFGVLALNAGSFWLTWRFTPRSVWPKRCARFIAAWLGSKRPAMTRKARAAKAWPRAAFRETFKWWMLWRIRPHDVAIPQKLTCRACGLRDRHLIEFHAPAKKIVAKCLRCRATWPEDPIYDPAGWMPPMPKVKEE